MKNRKMKFLLAVAIIVTIIAISITMMQKKENSESSNEQKLGQIEVIEKDVKSKQKSKTENNESEEPAIELKEDNSKDFTFKDLEPVKYREYPDEKMNKFPFIVANEKRFYKQYGVYVQDSVYRGDEIGQIQREVENPQDAKENGDAYRVSEGTDILANNFSKNILMSPDFSLSSYFVYSPKQLYYTKLQNIINHADKVKNIGIYINYYNSDDIPLPEKVENNFLKDLEEIPYNFNSYTESVGADKSDSLIYFDFGDGMIYSYRAYFDPQDQNIYLVDVLNVKEYKIKNPEQYKEYFLTTEMLMNELGLSK